MKERRQCNQCQNSLKEYQQKFCSVTCFGQSKKIYIVDTYANRMKTATEESKNWSRYWEYRFKKEIPVDEKHLENYMVCHYNLMYKKYYNNKSKEDYLEIPFIW